MVVTGSSLILSNRPFATKRICMHLHFFWNQYVCLCGPNYTFPLCGWTTCTEKPSSFVHWTHSGKKGSLWKENTTTSLLPLPVVIAPQAKCGIDWQGFQFQSPQSCQRQTSQLPGAHHIGPIVSADAFLLLTTDVTFLFSPSSPLFVAQTAAHMRLRGLIPECFCCFRGSLLFTDIKISFSH